MWDSNETTCVIRVRDAAAFGEHHLLKCLVRAKISPFGGKKNPLSGWNQSCRRSLAILEAASWSSFYSITVINKKLSPYLSVYLFLNEIYTCSPFFLHRINLDDLFPNFTLLSVSARMQNYFWCISSSVTSKYYFYIVWYDWSLKLRLPLWTLSYISQLFLNALRKDFLPTS